MASAMYGPGKQGLLTGLIDLDTDDIRAMLVKSAYTFVSTHQFVADLPAATADNGRSGALGSVTASTAGVVDASDSSLTATSAAACNAIILLKHTGADATARLICYLDVAAFTPSASQTVTITWDNGASKIFAWNG